MSTARVDTPGGQIAEARPVPPVGRRPRWRRYLFSVPERTLRLLALGLGGTLYESSRVLLPGFVRRSKLYDATVARMLRLTVELLGGVEGVYEAEPIPAADLLARKTAGNAVELASILAVGWSPLWLLAGAADVTGGSKVYLRALMTELKAAGLLPALADAATVDELLSRVEATSAVLADAIDIPPYRPADLRASWATLRRQLNDPPGTSGLLALGADLQRVAREQGRPLPELAAALSLAAARAGARLGTDYVLDDYRRALQAVAAEGVGEYLQRTGRPYLKGAGRHLDPARPTYTERFLVRARRLLHHARQQAQDRGADGSFSAGGTTAPRRR